MYISIITIKGYEKALDMLLESIPETFRNIIIIYQNEENESVSVNEKDHIIVKIRHNIYEYGSFIGLYRVFELNLISEKEIILLLHDTCKLGKKSIELSQQLEDKIIRDYKSDILFISSKGSNNICFVNKTAINYGYNVYKDIYTIPKSLAIEWELNFYMYDQSMKALYVKRSFLDIEPEFKGRQKIYGDDVERDIVYFSVIDLEKYFYRVDLKQPYHPEKP